MLTTCSVCQNALGVIFYSLIGFAVGNQKKGLRTNRFEYQQFETLLARLEDGMCRGDKVAWRPPRSASLEESCSCEIALQEGI